MASGVGARLGCLFKTGPALEASHKIDTVVFDKTGTLTRGHAAVVSWKVLHRNWSPARFWQLVQSAENGSDHPIAKGIVDYAQMQHKLSILSVETSKIIAGRGVECVVDGHDVIIGNYECMLDFDVEPPKSGPLRETNVDRAWEKVTDEIKSSAGGGIYTEIFVAVDDQVVGWIALQDLLKHDSHAVVQALRSMDIDVWILSGDNTAVTHSVASQLQIPLDHAQGALLPADKADVVRRLQGQGHVVAMVGDGVNDSPALGAADVGIAVSRSTDIAIGTANVVLMHDDMFLVVNAIELARATYKRILVNFAWAFFYNIIAVPFAAGLLYPALHISIPPAFAGLSELLSSLPVVLFSVLLRNFTPTLTHARVDGLSMHKNPRLSDDDDVIDDDDDGENIPLV